VITVTIAIKAYAPNANAQRLLGQRLADSLGRIAITAFIHLIPLGLLPGATGHQRYSCHIIDDLGRNVSV
jgi:hypothetical protein